MEKIALPAYACVASPDKSAHVCAFAIERFEPAALKGLDFSYAVRRSKRAGALQVAEIDLVKGTW